MVTILKQDFTFLFICIVLLVLTKVLIPKKSKKAPKSIKTDDNHLEFLRLHSQINELKRENEKLKSEISRINSCIQFICEQCKIFYF